MYCAYSVIHAAFSVAVAPSAGEPRISPYWNMSICAIFDQNAQFSEGRAMCFAASQRIPSTPAFFRLTTMLYTIFWIAVFSLFRSGIPMFFWVVE